MITENIKTEINALWDASWPTSQLRPLILLDLLSYLLFIKKLEDCPSLTGGQLYSSGSDGNFIDPETQDELGWSRFKDMDRQSRLKLFTKEKGVLDCIKSYGTSNFRYSKFLHGPLLLKPTSRLLSSMINIVKIMFMEDMGTRADIYEYLVNNSEVISTTGQVYAPPAVTDLMISLIQPTIDDVIFDPAAGNCSVLVKSAMYIAGDNSMVNLNDRFAGGMLSGIESDPVQLRIGAMNMMLHGMEDAKIAAINDHLEIITEKIEQATLIVSNLYFQGTEDKLVVEPTSIELKSAKKEIILLNVILKNMKSGQRAAVLIPQYILYDNQTDTIALRRQIMDICKLEAVINFPGKAKSLFSNSAIVIFTKAESGATQKVWFYKMKVKNSEKNTKDSILTDSRDHTWKCEYDDVDIFIKWHKGAIVGSNFTQKGLFVTANEIRNNNYNLSLNQYNKGIQTKESLSVHETNGLHKPISINTNNNNETKAGEIRKRTLKQLRPLKKEMRILLLFLVTCAAVTAYYFFYENNNHARIIASGTHILETLRVKNTTSGLTTDTVVTLTSVPKSKNKPSQVITGNVISEKKLDNKLVNKSKPVGSIAVKKPDEVSEPSAIDTDSTKARYAVKMVAHFHNSPDQNTRRAAYITHWNNAVLTPIDDKNGFVFITYTNNQGQTSKGWLNKKDLRALK